MPNTPQRDFLRAVLFSYVFAGLAFPLAYGIRLLYADAFSVAEFGLFYALISFLNTLMLFSDLGISETLSYFIPKFLLNGQQNNIKRAASYALITQLVLTTLIGATLFFAADFIATGFFKAPEAALLLRALLTYYLFFNLGNTALGVLRGYQKNEYYTSYDFVRQLLILVGSACIIFFVKPENLLMAVAILWGIVFAITAGVYSLAALRTVQKTPKKQQDTDPKLFIQLANYAIPVVISYGALTLFAQIDTLMITALRTLDEVGLYNAAAPTARILLTFFYPLGLVLFPIFSKYHHKGDTAYLSQILSAIYNLGIYLFVPFALSLFLFPDIAIRILFGESFIEAALALRILTIAFVFSGFNTLNFNAIAGLGMIKERAKLMYGTLAFNIVGNLIIIPIYGFIGAALTTAASHLIIFVMTILAIRKRVPFKTSIRTGATTAASAIAFVGTVLLLKHLIAMPALIELSVVGATAFSVYFITGFFLKAYDIRAIIQLVRNGAGMRENP